MPDDSELRREIRDVLMQDWDPIGVAGVPQASDEYDDYVRDIAETMASGASVATLAAYLVSIEAGRMGLTADAERYPRHGRCGCRRRRARGERWQ